MKMHTAVTAVTLPANTFAGLRPKQFAARAHNLVKTESQDLPDDFIACEVKKPIQLKIGEVFYAEELPKFMASLVEEIGEPGAESKDEKPKAKGKKAE